MVRRRLTLASGAVLALVLWRTRGVVPRVLRLLYLKDAEACDYAPEPEELMRFERTVLALWRAIAAMMPSAVATLSPAVSTRATSAGCRGRRGGVTVASWSQR